MTIQNHGECKTEAQSQHKHRQAQTKLSSEDGRTHVEILAYGLIIAGTITGIIAGILYQQHKVPMVLVIGLTILLPKGLQRLVPPLGNVVRAVKLLDADGPAKLLGDCASSWA